MRGSALAAALITGGSQRSEGILTLLQATLFLRVQLHADSAQEGSLYFSCLFFSLIMLFFDGEARVLGSDFYFMGQARHQACSQLALFAVHAADWHPCLACRTH